MRFLCKIHIPVETGNDMARAGKLGTTIQAILEEQKPECVYLLEEEGERTVVMVVEMAEASQLPVIAEPWFLAFDAAFIGRPAMVPADLMKSMDKLAELTKKYG